MHTLKITDGTTTCNFDGTDGYHLLWGEWSPAVSQLRTDQRGNMSPYESVIDNMRLWIEGEVGDTAHDKLNRLTQLLHQAQRWWNCEGPACVYVEFRIDNSSLGNTLRSEILGVPDRFMDLPGDFAHSGQMDRIGDKSNPITIQFRRSGLWLNWSQEQEIVSAAANPSKLTATFATDPEAASPVNLRITDIDPLAGIDAGFMIAVRAENDVYITELEGASGSGASQADSTALARGGSVRRLTGSTLADQTFGISSITTFNTTRKVAILAAIRNNNNARSWKVYVELQNSDGITIGRTRVKVIDGSYTNPQIVMLGLAICDYQQISQFNVVAAIDSTTGSRTIDFDYLVLVNLDHAENRIIAYGERGTNRNGYEELKIYPKMLEAPDPVVQYGTIDLPARGDRYLAYSGTGMTVMILGTYSTYWCIVDASGPSRANLGAIVDRYAGYLAPL